MAGLNFERVGGLLLVAAIVAIIVRRLRLPYTVGLVAAGVVLALSPIHLEIELTKKLIFTVFLPPLIFEAAFHMPGKELRRNFAVVLTLATLGVVLSAALTAAGMRFLAGWGWKSALLFGCLIAATDPVSVIATFKEAGVRGRLWLLAEAEALFNDGTAAVLFGFALALTAGARVDAWSAVAMLAVTVIGGVLCGALVAGAALLLAGRTDDHLVEITFTSVAAYGSFLLAQHFGFSGVLATLTTGILIGNSRSLGAISPRGREAVESFWEYVAFAVNSLVFILIGMYVARQQFENVALLIVTAIVVVVVSRAAAIYPCCALFWRSKLKVEMRHQHVLFWGGLRGALALALALGLPRAVPHRAEVITVAFAVAAFSIVVQGLTMSPLLRRLGVLQASRAAEHREGAAGETPH
jgi:CPA1 family monovalent cation:H+ antiporter